MGFSSTGTYAAFLQAHFFPGIDKELKLFLGAFPI
jgi:hypothetical protein